MVKIHSIYNRPIIDGVEFTQPSQTQQHFKSECDINNIVNNYTDTALKSQMSNRHPQYGDYTAIPDYHEAQQIIVNAQESFAALPAVIRKKFENDPANLLAFLEDDANREEAIKLGLVNPTPIAHREANEPLSPSPTDDGLPPKS